MKTPQVKISNVSTSPFAVSLGIHELVSNAQIAHTNAIEQLKADSTRTDDDKKRAAAQYGQKLLTPLHTAANKVYGALVAESDSYAVRLNNELKVKGTTDAILLQSAALVVKDASLKQILEIVREHKDLDVARASLLIPALRINPEIREGAGMIQKMAEELILGVDYQLYLEVTEKKADAKRLMEGLEETHGEFQAQIDVISGKAWAEPDSQMIKPLKQLKDPTADNIDQTKEIH